MSVGISRRVVGEAYIVSAALGKDGVVQAVGAKCSWTKLLTTAYLSERLIVDVN